jgi:hypothetical protein
MMPEGAADSRGKMKASLASTIHEKVCVKGCE